MHRTRAIKKKTRNRLILLKNLNKGKARKEPRCTFQMIPLPAKYDSGSQMHLLHGDLLLMEHNDNFVLEASLYNNFKIYKSAQVVNYPTQKVLRIKVENKDSKVETADWKPIVEALESSQSSHKRDYACLIRNYCQRYEDVMTEFNKQEMSRHRYQSLNEMNEKTEKTRQNIIRTYPCMELKSQLKDGQIELSEISFSEKYLAELGYSLDTFATTVLHEGIPEQVPINSDGADMIAKLRLKKYLTIESGGYQTPEFECCMAMKNGCLKKVKMVVHYLESYEKGVLGFYIIGAIVAKQRPFIRDVNPFGEMKLERDFVQMMAQKEKETNEFLSNYYDQMLEQKYTNRDKVCKIKEIKDMKEN